MSTPRICVILGGLATAGAVLGGGFGAVVGLVAPGYYLAMFGKEAGMGFNPIEVGLGLGAGQGGAAGFVLGLVVTGIFAWRAASLTADSSQSEATPDVGSSWKLLRAAKLIGFALLLVFTSGVSFLAGGIAGQSDLYRRRATHETRLVEERLNEVSQGGEFTRIEFSHTSNGFVSLSGSVASKSDFDRMYRELQDLFGTERANDLSARVAISPSVGPVSEVMPAQ